MEADFSHPAWIIAGVAMILVGIWLIRWASRNNMAAAISSATAEVAINALRKGGKIEMPSDVRGRMSDLQANPSATAKAKKVAGYAFRQSMSQLFGVIGFILVVSGLVSALLGIFYD